MVMCCVRQSRLENNAIIQSLNTVGRYSGMRKGIEVLYHLSKVSSLLHTFTTIFGKNTLSTKMGIFGVMETIVE